jgi:hypothetical protein
MSFADIKGPDRLPLQCLANWLPNPTSTDLLDASRAVPRAQPQADPTRSSWHRGATRGRSSHRRLVTPPGDPDTAAAVLAVGTNPGTGKPLACATVGSEDTMQRAILIAASLTAALAPGLCRRWRSGSTAPCGPGPQAALTPSTAPAPAPTPPGPCGDRAHRGPGLPAQRALPLFLLTTLLTGVVYRRPSPSPARAPWFTTDTSYTPTPPFQTAPPAASCRDGAPD